MDLGIPQDVRPSYRLALSDVDGTLLRSTHELSRRTISAVRSWTESGRSFAIATGRMPAGIGHIVGDLGVPVHLVCYSGALVLDADGHVVSSRTLDRSVASRVLDIARSGGYGIAYSFFVGPDWFAPDPGAKNIEHEASIVKASPAKADLEEMLLQGIEPNKIFFNCSCDLDAGARLADRLAQDVRGAKVIHSTSGVLLEVIPEGVDKALGAADLAAYLGVPMDELVAIGDDVNDVELLRAAGLGVAVENAAQDVRAQADRIAPSNDQDGVAAVLEGVLRGDVR